MIVGGAGILPRSTLLELTIGGAELAELHRKRAALFRDMAKRSAAKLDAPARPSSTPHMHRASHGPDLIAAAYDRGQRRFHIAQLERSADILNRAPSTENVECPECRKPWIDCPHEPPRGGRRERE